MFYLDRDEFSEDQDEGNEKIISLLELLSVQILHMSTVLTFLLEHNKDVPKEVKAISRANLKEVIDDFKDKTQYVTLFGLNNFIKEYLG